MHKIKDAQLVSILQESNSPRLLNALDNYLQGNRVSPDGKVSSLLLGLTFSGYQHPTFLYYPELNSKPIFSKSDDGFCWAQLLENNFDEIRNECLSMLEKDFYSTPIKSTVKGKWNSIPFIEEGQIVQKNCNLCPFTTKLLFESVPLLKDCLLGYCYISILYPGTQILPHYGVSNVKLRCHLPLSVPTSLSINDLGMKIGGEVCNWKVGNCLLFDDSYQHEVWYNSNSDSTEEINNDDNQFTSNLLKQCRIVLLFDFWHPDLSDIEKKALLYCLSNNKIGNS